MKCRKPARGVTVFPGDLLRKQRPVPENHLALRSKPIPLFIDGVLDQFRISVDQPSVGVG